MDNINRIVMGILAHVDSGKTTLSEAMLYSCGEIRSIGRVDHKNAFLDTDLIEKERGITIFSKQAIINMNNTKLTLLDTPGHVDFSSETERALWALDYAVLVVSGVDGVQSHTGTLWKLLKEHGVPVFVFVNKMDISHRKKDELIEILSKKLGDGFVDFTSDNFHEEAAIYDERLMDSFLENTRLDDKDILKAIRERRIFPCYFGSALKNDGVDALLKGIELYAKPYNKGEKFGARVYKISEDERKIRLSFMKITSGKLSVKDIIEVGSENEKINEIRIYSGARYKNVQEVYPGDVCAVCGLVNTYNGQGLGIEKDAPTLKLEPAFIYKIIPQQGADMRVVMSQLKKLEEEESQLRVSWNQVLGEIHLLLMGEIQLEVLKRMLKDRFNLEADFDEGGILYKETIKSPVEGAGHYEPLKHYAEVHLLLEPLPRGSGIVIEADCSEDLLSRNWQRLILTHLKEKEHVGVLTGSPITDIKITLKSGKAHLKHTEGGDFRQATYRAVRHGLRRGESVLLEPFYDFTLEIPSESTGRAMTDLEKMGASINPPVINENKTTLTGRAPVKELCHYQRDVTQYTKGLGVLSVMSGGYEECQNPEDVIETIGYDCDGDLNNTADSVFCSHGAGYSASWEDAMSHMHLESIMSVKSDIIDKPLKTRTTCKSYTDEELMEIFERTYGKIEHKNYNAIRVRKKLSDVKKVRSSPQKKSPEYLLIDGYNIIFAWDRLSKIANDNLEDARHALIESVCDLSVFNEYNIILVFDAYRVKGTVREIEKIRNISVVYTKEAETADAYIEKITRELGKKHIVRVATSDALEQMIILGNGAQRLPASAFIKELEDIEVYIKEMVKKYNQDSMP